MLFWIRLEFVFEGDFLFWARLNFLCKAELRFWAWLKVLCEAEIFLLGQTQVLILRQKFLETLIRIKTGFVTWETVVCSMSFELQSTAP